VRVTAEEIMASHYFAVADEERWPYLIAGVNGSAVTVFYEAAVDPVRGTLYDAVDAWSIGHRDDGFLATATQPAETVLDRVAWVHALLDTIVTNTDEEE